MTRGQSVRAGSVGVVTPESWRWWQDASQEMHPGVNVAKGQLRANVCWVHKQPWCSQSSIPQANYQPGWRCCCESLLREGREALMASILLPVDMPYSVWSARVFFFFFFFQDSARCQYRCVKCHRTWLRLLQGTDSLPAYCTLCISFHRRENLGCVSGSSAHLEHLIFCPGKLEAECLRQKVWVPDWVANDP